jgi:transcriptional regulator with XRE-family HTH domain
MKENKIRTKILAEKTGIDADYLDQIRAGYRRPSPEKAKLIADAIGINVMDILFPKDEERQDSVARQAADVSL